MNIEISATQLGMVLASLNYTRLEFAECSWYPSEEFRRDALRRVDELIGVLRQQHEPYKKEIEA